MERESAGLLGVRNSNAGNMRVVGVETLGECGLYLERRNDGRRHDGYKTFPSPSPAEPNPAASYRRRSPQLPTVPPRSTSDYISSNRYIDDCHEAAEVSHWHWLWRRRTMVRLLLAPAILLMILATLTWSLPAFPLEERQLGAPPLNDFLNVSRPANMSEYDPETWTLGTHTLVQNAWQVQPYVANGYHGSRLTAEGPGYWVCVMSRPSELEITLVSWCRSSNLC